VRRKAFTLIELLVAMGLLAIVMVMASTIFRVAVESYRMAKANAEVMQKLRIITSQLDRDLQGLCQQDQAFAVCLTQPDPNNQQGHSRFDRIVFFANGDFESYNQVQPQAGGPAKTVHGNVALISYMLARYRASNRWIQASRVRPSQRIMARTQHILTPEEFKDALDPNGGAKDGPKNSNDWYRWHNRQEHDHMTLLDWAHLSETVKANALSVITDVDVEGSTLTADPRGACVDPCDPNSSIHMLLCEGVGEFAVQGWDEDDPNHWAPRTNDKGTLGQTSYQGSFPGQGRALKFTFTLYDSKGIFKKGRTFTHIVDLSD